MLPLVSGNPAASCWGQACPGLACPRGVGGTPSRGHVLPEPAPAAGTPVLMRAGIARDGGDRHSGLISLTCSSATFPVSDLPAGVQARHPQCLNQHSSWG